MNTIFKILWICSIGPWVQKSQSFCPKFKFLRREKTAQIATCRWPADLTSMSVSFQCRYLGSISPNIFRKTPSKRQVDNQVWHYHKHYWKKVTIELDGKWFVKLNQGIDFTNVFEEHSWGLSYETNVSVPFDKPDVYNSGVFIYLLGEKLLWQNALNNWWFCVDSLCYLYKQKGRLIATIKWDAQRIYCTQQLNVGACVDTNKNRSNVNKCFYLLRYQSKLFWEIIFLGNCDQFENNEICCVANLTTRNIVAKLLLLLL